jgi:hypothetical protein
VRHGDPDAREIDQALEHPADLFGIGDDRGGLSFAHDVDSSTDLHLRLKLVVRAVRDMEVKDVLRRVMPSESFGDVRRYRHA